MRVGSVFVGVGWLFAFVVRGAASYLTCSCGAPAALLLGWCTIRLASLTMLEPVGTTDSAQAWRTGRLTAGERIAMYDKWRPCSGHGGTNSRMLFQSTILKASCPQGRFLLPLFIQQRRSRYFFTPLRSPNKSINASGSTISASYITPEVFI